MKNTLMIVIILAGFATAIYRFLPTDLKDRIDIKFGAVTGEAIASSVAAANAFPDLSPHTPKYVLHIPDSGLSAHSKQDSDVANTHHSKKGSDIANAYMQHLNDVQVSDQGEVIKILLDDTNGSRHQRFIVRSQAGLTVLIAHNIDLARRIDSLGVGDSLSFYGEYEWNEKGGVVHWTHRDPRGNHPAGWIKHKGVTYF